MPNGQQYVLKDLRQQDSERFSTKTMENQLRVISGTELTKLLMVKAHFFGFELELSWRHNSLLIAMCVRASGLFLTGAGYRESHVALLCLHTLGLGS